MDGVDGIAFDPRTPESKVQYGTDMILITDETWNLARAKQSQYQKENLRKRKWKLYQIPHKAAQELFANATQLKQEKKKIFSFVGSNCKTLQMLLPVGDEFERANSAFSVCLWYIVH